MNIKKNIIKTLKTCYDPEIPLDLWSLGLIYDINITNSGVSGNDISIIMSLTTPGCSMGQHMADDIKNKVSKLDQVKKVNVTITFEPPWNPQMMTDEARNKLGFETINQVSQTKKIETEWE
tara:strand:- start:149 stop:511 length:363 start_codon:yes stop_codon:yes gene_type:complete